MSKYVAMVSLLSLLGCRDGGATNMPAPPPAQKPPALERMAIAAAVPEAQPAPQPARIPLAQRLAREAAARPPDALRTEVLIEALAMRGINVAPPRQVLASPVGALYCEAAASARGLALSLCAYADAAELASGRARSHALFDRLIPGRTLIGHGKTLLTLAPTPAAAQEAAIADQLFAELSR
jgi:hypothetical protein